MAAFSTERANEPHPGNANSPHVGACFCSRSCFKRGNKFARQNDLKCAIRFNDAITWNSIASYRRGKTLVSISEKRIDDSLPSDLLSVRRFGLVDFRTGGCRDRLEHDAQRRNYRDAVEAQPWEPDTCDGDDERV